MKISSFKPKKRLRLLRLFSAEYFFYRFVRTRLKKELRILGYHRVLEPGQAFDENNVSASPSEFEQQVDYLKKNYDPINFSDLEQIANVPSSCPARPVIITFDDGFTDNFINAYPILKSHGVTATFFVTTDYVNKEELYWFDKVALLIFQAEPGSVLELSGVKFEVGKSPRQTLINDVLDRMKKLENAERIKETEKLFRDFEIDLSSPTAQLSLPMKWCQLRQMAGDGMSIQSHSHTHPILSKLEQSQDILYELTKSKETIEREIGTTCSTIAYPVGNASTYDQRVLSSLPQAGYRYACSYIAGINELPRGVEYELKRIHINAGTTLSQFSALLAWPELFSY